MLRTVHPRNEPLITLPELNKATGEAARKKRVLSTLAANKAPEQPEQSPTPDRQPGVKEPETDLPPPPPPSPPATEMAAPAVSPVASPAWGRGTRGRDSSDSDAESDADSDDGDDSSSQGDSTVLTVMREGIDGTVREERGCMNG